VRNRIRRMLREWMRLHGWVPRVGNMVLVAKTARQGRVIRTNFASDLERILAAAGMRINIHRALVWLALLR